MNFFGVLPGALRNGEGIPDSIMSSIYARQLSSDAKRIAAEQRGRQQASAVVPDAVRAADVRWDAHQAQLRIEASKRTEQQRKTASLLRAICFERNPGAIKQAHETEAKRLAALQSEIEADIREQAWTAPKN